MEMTYYTCPICGFTYQVPSYWSDHAPDEELELEHIDLKTKEPCSGKILALVKEMRK